MKRENWKFFLFICCMVFFADVILIAQTMYTVTYNGNGNTGGTVPVDKNRYPAGKSVTALGNIGKLFKTGYVLTCWSTSTGAKGTDVQFGEVSKMPAANLTLYAKWTVDPKAVSKPAPALYTVSYNGNGNSGGSVPVDKNQYAEGQSVVASGNTGGLVRTGYVLLGWNTRADLKGTDIKLGGTEAMPASNVTLYAIWALEYTITFDSQAATIPANPPTKNVIAGSSAGTLPSAPTKSGSVFGGWFTAANGGGSAFTSGTAVNANITVFAKWATIVTYTVNFDGQSATAPANPASMAVTTPATSVGTLPTAPTRTGYTFVGWYAAPNGGGSTFAATTPVTANLTVYAKWTANAYTVIFDGQSATTQANPSSIPVTYPATTVVNLPAAPIRPGFTFGGWFMAPNGGGSAFAGNTPVSNNLTVYAKWTTNAYTVVFDGQSATTQANPSSITVTYPATTVVSLPAAPIRPGFTFGGWFTGLNGGGSAFAATTPVTANLTVYAKWAANSYTVTYRSQYGNTSSWPGGGKIVTSPAMTVGTLPAGVPTNIVNIAFVGWYTAPDGGGTEFTASTPVTADITVYAKWMPCYQVYFTNTLEQYGQNVIMKTVVRPAMTVDTLPVLSKPGYIFGGWYTAQDGGGSQFTTSTSVTRIITVYSKWTGFPYTVTFDGLGAYQGGNPSVISGTYPAYLNTWPSTPLKNGYFFGGWYTAPYGGGSKYTGGPVTENIRVYAKWMTTSKVSFHKNTYDGTEQIYSVMTITSPATTVGSLPTPPAQANFTFEGWYEYGGTGSRLTATTPVTEDTTVYAKWMPIYTVIFNSQGGNIGNVTINVLYPATTVNSLPAAPIRTGYTFDGWYTAVNGGGSAFTTATPVARNITVYAKWVPERYTITYDGNGNTAGTAPQNQMGDFGITISIAWNMGNLAKDNKAFAGWNTKADGTGTDYTVGQIIQIPSNLTLYAKWAP